VAVTARDLNPILRNLKMVAEDGRCTLLATDLELSIRLEVRGVQVEEAGEAILPAARTTAILREATDEEVHLEASHDACQVRGRTAEFEMPSEDPANFPEVPAFAAEQYHEIAAGELRRLIRRTAFAAAKENARYSMTGVLWELEEGVARLVATDGRRLAVAQSPATAHGGHTTKGQTPVVPSKAVDLLDRNLDDDEELVRVSLRPNEVLFKTERATLCSRLVEGRYPSYRDVFPKKQPVKIPLPVGPFLTAVRQAAIMMDEETRRVTFGFAKGKLTLQAHGKETGRSKVEMPVEYDGKALNVSFNPAFLIEMLRTLDADAVLTADLVDAGTVGVFRLGEEYSYLVMPLT
jgi:DNA polymerase-3 subunit beta